MSKCKHLMGLCAEGAACKGTVEHLYHTSCASQDLDELPRVLLAAYCQPRLWTT